MTDQPMITLNDGYVMPHVGQGVYQVLPPRAVELIKTAIELGYRAVDTASFYRNEREVGEAVRASSETIFVTTKLINNEQGRDKTLAAFDRQFGALGLDWLDLYLIHWPAPSLNLYLETWRTLIELRDEGRVRSIGVSNFTIEHLERIIGETGVVPATNQIELHPALQQNELVEFHRRHGITTTSWSPLGQGKLFDEPVLRSLATRHGKTQAQIILRWHIERGLLVIPKASSRERLAENLALFDFALDGEDMAQIATLDRNQRIGPHPDSM